MELLDGLVGAGDVGERDLGGVLGDQLGLGLAELHDPGAAALHLAHQEPEQADEQDDDREQLTEQVPERVGALDLVGVAVGQAGRRAAAAMSCSAAGVDVVGRAPWWRP